MTSSKVLTIIAIIAVIVSALNLGVIVLKSPSVVERINGFAAYSGYVNVTVSTLIALNISRNTINWGSGLVNTTGGFLNATLSTSGETATVVRGNWSTTGVAGGIIIANVGNINCSLTLKAGKTAATFFGGTSGQYQYQWNISNKQANSCSGGTETMNSWRDVNVSAAGTFCSQMGFNSTASQVYMDILLTVPYDAVNTGAQSDTITVTAATAI